MAASNWVVEVQLTRALLGVTAGIKLEMVLCRWPITIADSKHMPFLNRRNEIATMALTFAGNAIMLREPSTVTDLRAINLLVASQMFGSGKTALGWHFIDELCTMEDDELVNAAKETGWTMMKELKVRCQLLSSSVAKHPIPTSPHLTSPHLAPSPPPRHSGGARTPPQCSHRVR